VLCEHLVAIALQDWRSKDQALILQFIERDALDGSTLQGILKQHGLTDKWKQFVDRYVEAFPPEEEMRKRLTEVSFSEKVKILEKLRDRSLALAASGLRQEATDRTTSLTKDIKKV